MRCRSGSGWRLGGALLCLSLAGCAHLPLDARYAGPARLPADVAAYYASPHPPAEVTIEPVREQKEFREFLVRFPLAADFTPTEPTVEIEWFESTEPGRRAAIIFNPILGGDYPLERGLCRFFAKHGFHVALVHRKTLKISPEHPVEHLEFLLRQGIVRIRQVVDWVERQERVDPQRMGGFGLSMGGIAELITAAVEPRLQVHVVALAGGSLPDILVTSKDKLLTKPLAKYLAYHHMELKELEARLRESVKTDPLRLAPYADARRMLMFIALADRTIGTANSLRLWRAVGKPRVIFMPLGHYTSYLYVPYMRYASLKFFAERLHQPIK